MRLGAILVHLDRRSSVPFMLLHLENQTELHPGAESLEHRQSPHFTVRCGLSTAVSSQKRMMEVQTVSPPQRNIGPGATLGLNSAVIVMTADFDPSSRNVG